MCVVETLTTTGDWKTSCVELLCAERCSLQSGHVRFIYAKQQYPSASVSFIFWVQLLVNTVAIASYAVVNDQVSCIVPILLWSFNGSFGSKLRLLSQQYKRPFNSTWNLHVRPTSSELGKLIDQHPTNNVLH